MFKGIVRRPDIVRRLQRVQKGQEPPDRTEFREMLRRKRAVDTMLETEGWQLFQAEMQRRAQEAYLRIADEHTTTADAIAARPAVVAARIMEKVLGKFTAEGENAEKALKESGDDERS